jgi:hypothetical protein
MKFYHRTTAEFADAILAGGFMDYTSNYMTSASHTGVWLSNTPVDEGDVIPAVMNSLLLVEISLSEKELAEYEWVQEGSGSYREWLIPASVINANSKVTMIEDE